MKYFALPLVALLLVGACDKGAEKPDVRPNAAGLVEEGYDMLRADKSTEAVVLFDKALASDNKNIRAYQGKGIALNNLGKHEEAENVYITALRLQPTSVGVTNNLAMSYILRGEYQDAVELLKPLSENHPKDHKIQANLALANCMLGKKDDASKIFSKHLSKEKVAENLKFCSDYAGMRKNDADSK